MRDRGWWRGPGSGESEGWMDEEDEGRGQRRQKELKTEEDRKRHMSVCTYQNMEP